MSLAVQGDKGGNMSKIAERLQALKERQMKGMDYKTRVQESIEYAEQFTKLYEENDIIDPSASLQIDGVMPVSCPQFTVLAATERRAPDHVFTMDIEAWGLRPDKIHNGYLLNIDTREHFQFRSFHHVFEVNVDKAKNGKMVKTREILFYGLIEKLEDILYELWKEDPYVRIHVYAHNFVNYDGVALAHHLTSNVELDYGIERLGAEEKETALSGISKKDRFEMLAHAKRVCKKGLSIGINTIKRKRDYEVDGKKFKKTFTWSITENKRKPIIKLRLGNAELRLLDSYWLLPTSLKELGAKGTTPKQYTDPTGWLDDEFAAGRLEIDEALEHNKKLRTMYNHWFNHLDPESDKYCLNDCHVLADALTLYRKVYSDAVKDPQTGESIDPLGYMTIPQAALAAMVMQTQPHKLHTQGALIHDPGMRSQSKWRYESDPVRVMEFIRDNEVQLQRDENGNIPIAPFAKRGEYTVRRDGWWCHRSHVLAFKSIQAGGRTEIFQPRNADGTYVLVIDKNSMYSDAEVNNRYLDPRFLKPLEHAIKGKADIMEHLSSRSGMYCVQMRRATNPIVRDELPVFCSHLGGNARDSRLIFGSWNGTQAIMVSGEELRYFLRITEVENDEILVHARKSITAPLLAKTATPMYHFAGNFYRWRMEAQRRGDSAVANTLKLILNAGGYGTLVQQNDSDVLLRDMPGDEATEMALLQTMMPLSPDWDGWADLEAGESPVEIGKRWAADHYRAWSNADIIRDDGRASTQQINIDLPDQMAGHAIRPWGCAIAANGRVTLHKALMAVRQAGFGLLYCDTDSVHFEVPNDVPVEEALRRIQDVKQNGQQVISIGTDLNQWKVESQKANPELIMPDSDVDEHGNIVGPQAVYLAPKHYYFLDRAHNVLKDVVKSIPKNQTLMRCAMIGYFSKGSKLGDPRGVRFSMAFDRDLAKRIREGKGAKRRYRSDVAPSTPIELKNPQSGGKCEVGQYIRDLSAINRGSAAGLREALFYYEDHAKIKGRRYKEVRDEIKGKLEELRRIAQTDPDGLHVNFGQEFLMKHGLVDETAEAEKRLDMAGI